MKNWSYILLLFFAAGCGRHPAGGEILPSFNVLLADSTTQLNMGKVATGSPIVLLYFSPDCEHCQKETEEILHHMDALKQARFYFVTNDPFDRLQIFYKYYKLRQYPNVVLGRDDQFFLLRHFKGAYPPYIVVYDRDKRQRAAWQGDTPIDTIISRVNNL
jgi:hypothetical protein